MCLNLHATYIYLKYEPIFTIYFFVLKQRDWKMTLPGFAQTGNLSIFFFLPGFQAVAQLLLAIRSFF